MSEGSMLFMLGDPACFIVAENPDEVERKIDQAQKNGDTFIIVTGPQDDDGHPWSGRSLRMRATDIVAIVPPMPSDDDD